MAAPDLEAGTYCALCERAVPACTRHHLIPRTRHGKQRSKRLYEKASLQSVLELCGACHAHLHALFTARELEEQYNNLEALKANPEVAKFVAFIKTRPPGFVPKTRLRRGNRRW